VQVFLIRHPRPLVEPGVCYGRLDVDCADPQLVAERLQLPAATTILSSPLRRARRLAEALAVPARVEVQLDARLSEIDFGDWEGRRWDDIDRAAIDDWAADVLNFTPPRGESVADLQRRVVDLAGELAATCGVPHVALVTHAGVIRALLGHWRGLPTAEWTQLKCDFGSCTQIEI
jgi:alpha-ribazole phosphatase